MTTERIDPPVYGRTSAPQRADRSPAPDERPSDRGRIATHETWWTGTGGGAETGARAGGGRDLGPVRRQRQGQGQGQGQGGDRRPQRVSGVGLRWPRAPRSAEGVGQRRPPDHSRGRRAAKGRSWHGGDSGRASPAAGRRGTASLSAPSRRRAPSRSTRRPTGKIEKKPADRVPDAGWGPARSAHESGRDAIDRSGAADRSTRAAGSTTCAPPATTYAAAAATDVRCG